RFGSIHRNAYINSPRALTAHLSAKDDPRLLFAGQLTGVEGYTESAATGILAGINLARQLAGDEPLVPPPTTMLGALYRYVHTADPEHFQPMNANFGLLEPLEREVRDKAKKRELLVERALGDMDAFVAQINAEVGTRNAEPARRASVPRSAFRVPRSSEPFPACPPSSPTSAPSSRRLPTTARPRSTRLPAESP